MRAHDLEQLQQQWFSKCGSRTSVTGITWQVARNSNYLVLPGPTQPDSLRMGLSHLEFDKPPGDSGARPHLRSTVLQHYLACLF